MRAPGVTWEEPLHTSSARRGFAAAAILVSTLAAAPGPTTAAATPAPQPRPVAQTDDDRSPVLALHADRARRPDPFAVHTPPAAAPAATTTTTPPPSVPIATTAVAAPAPTATAARHRTSPQRTSTRSAPRPATTTRTRVPQAPAPSGTAAAVVAYARAQIGKPYVFGAAGPNAFDCSGLVMAAYRQAGITNLPHLASAFFNVGHAVPASDIRPGDILILEGGGHAAIAIGGGMMIHASRPGRPVAIAKIYARPDGVRRLIG